jgi:hypothetical protein
MYLVKFHVLTVAETWKSGSGQNRSKAICIVYANLSSSVSLVLQILGVADCTVEETATSECDGYNSAILPTSQFRQANKSQYDFALRPLARRQLHFCTLDELNQVV